MLFFLFAFLWHICEYEQLCGTHCDVFFIAENIDFISPLSSRYTCNFDGLLFATVFLSIFFKFRFILLKRHCSVELLYWITSEFHTLLLALTFVLNVLVIKLDNEAIAKHVAQYRKLHKSYWTFDHFICLFPWALYRSYVMNLFEDFDILIWSMCFKFIQIIGIYWFFLFWTNCE